MRESYHSQSSQCKTAQCRTLLYRTRAMVLSAELWFIEQKCVSQCKTVEGAYTWEPSYPYHWETSQMEAVGLESKGLRLGDIIKDLIFGDNKKKSPESQNAAQRTSHRSSRCQNVLIK